MRRLLAGGPGALAVLGDLVEAVQLLAERGDGILAAPALVPAGAARLRTPVPDAPLCYVLHGNAATVWCRQSEMDPNLHVMTRIPAMRIRTVNALLGHDEPLYLPATAKLSFGNELGFVIGQEARNVRAEDAYRYVAGYVCTNDCYSNVYSQLAADAPTRINSTMQVGDKATDGCGPVGPWIATAGGGRRSARSDIADAARRAAAESVPFGCVHREAWRRRWSGSRIGSRYCRGRLS